MYKISLEEQEVQDVQDAFEAISRPIRGKVEIDQYIDGENTIQGGGFFDDDYLQSIEIERGTQTESSFIGNTISAKYIIKILDTNRSLSFDGARIKPYIGVMVSDVPKYIPFAPAEVYTAEFDMLSKVWTLTCYDDMQKLAKYKIGDVIGDDFFETNTPSFKSYLSEICSYPELNISLPEEHSFYNDDEPLDSYPNINDEETVREVVGRLAEACLCNVVFNRSGELEFRNAISSTSVKTITPDHYYNYTRNSDFGPINSVVLSRKPLEDNLSISNEGSISTNGMTQLIIDNNPFLDRIAGEDNDTRYLYLDTDDNFNLLSTINGFRYYSYNLEWRGDPTLDSGDRITIVDLDGNSIDTNYYNDKIIFTGGLKSISNVAIKSQEYVDSESASLPNILKTAIAKVDKLNGAISFLVREDDAAYQRDAIAGAVSTAQDNYNSLNGDDGLISNVTAIRQNIENIEQSVLQAGGLNVIKNSLFFNNAEDWDSSSASFEVNQDTKLEKESDCGSELILQDGTISQSFFTLTSPSNNDDKNLEEWYTLAFKYKKDAAVLDRESSVKLYFTGVAEPVTVLSVTEGASDRKEVYYSYESTHTETKIEIYTDDDDFYITDLRLIRGKDRSPWSQHKNEIYGKGTILNNKGLIIKDENEDSTVYIHADNNSITIEDDKGIISELSAEKVMAPEAEILGNVTLNQIIVSHLSDSRIIIAKGGIEE